LALGRFAWTLVKRARLCADDAAMAFQSENDPFHWAGGTAGDPAGLAAASALAARRRTRRWLAAAGCIAAAAAAAIVVATSGGGGVALAGRALVSTPISLAADVTTSEAGFRFTLEIDETGGGRNVETTASGAIDERPAMSGSMAVEAGSQASQVLFVGPSMYMQLPNAPTPWVRVDLAAYEHALGVASIGGSADPSQALDFLREADAVTDLGNATIDGVLTTHYSAVADLERYALGVAPPLRAAAQQDANELRRLTGSTRFPLDVWVDRQDRVRQLGLSPPPVCSAAGPVQTATTIDYYDYGPQPPVAAPPSADVTNMTGPLVASAGAALSPLGC
jgi:hypothetical protein